MTKSLRIIFLVGVLIAFTSGQLDARTDVNGTRYTSAITNWNCEVSFIKQNQIIKVESLNPDDSDASLSDVDSIDHDDDNSIDAVSWNGTACNCWIILFDGDGYDGDSLGLWTTNTTTGSYDLSTFNYLQDTDILSGDDYKQWNTAVSSYRIYCF